MCSKLYISTVFDTKNEICINKANAMRSRFSERQFEQLINPEISSELNNIHDLRIYPEIPSQREENILGYDSKFEIKGRIYFLQYKVSQYLKTRAAKYRINNNNPDPRQIYNYPYYLFHLRETDDSKQHTILKKLAKNNSEGYEVYYVAPIFWKRLQYESYTGHNPISDNSIFIDLNDTFDITDTNFIKHEITYTNQIEWHQHSKAKKGLKAIRGNDFIKKIVSEVNNKPNTINKNYLLELVHHWTRNLNSFEIDLNDDFIKILYDINRYFLLELDINLFIVYQNNKSGRSTSGILSSHGNK